MLSWRDDVVHAIIDSIVARVGEERLGPALDQPMNTSARPCRASFEPQRSLPATSPSPECGSSPNFVGSFSEAAVGGPCKRPPQELHPSPFCRSCEAIRSNTQLYELKPVATDR
jgi:hypothetical protein